MRVLHVDTAAEWRGGQQQLAYLLGERPGDLWAGVPDSPLARRVRPPDLPLHPGNDPRNLLRLRLPPVDLVAAHTSHAHGAALLCGRPLVVHRRTDAPPTSLWKYRRATHFIAVSARIAAVLVEAGLPAERITVVHSGVVSRAGGRPVLDLPRPIYGAIGALAAHKGHEVAIAALRELPGSLVIAGEGDRRDFLLETAARLGVADRVHLLGQREDVADLFASFDVFVHPSHTEGLGQVIAEALSAGCRVVASAAGGIPEVVGAAGLLVPPGDVAALGRAMREALQFDPSPGPIQARTFLASTTAARTTAVYERVLAASRGV